jgi:HEAT repeat protein
MSVAMTIRTLMASMTLSLAFLVVGAGGAEAQSTTAAPPDRGGPEVEVLRGVDGTVELISPADTLYREARRALTRREYERAISLFTELRETEPESVHLADARYYEALARVNAVTETLSASDEDREALLAEVERATTRLAEARSLLEGREDREPVEETERLLERMESALAQLVVHRRALERGDTVSLPLTIEAERREVPFSVGAVSRPATTAIHPRVVGAPAFGVDTITRDARSLERAMVLQQAQAGALLSAATAERQVRSVPFSVSRYVPGLFGGLRAEVPPGCDEARLRERTAAFHALFDRDPAILDGLLDDLEAAGDSDPCAAPLRSTVFGHALATGALDRDRVVQALRNEPDPFTRQAALHALRESADPADMELLAEIARTDDDQTVRVLAAHTLLDLPDGVGRGRALALVEARELEARGVVMIVSEILSDASAEEAARVRDLFDQIDDDALRTAILAQLSISPREADRAWVRERVADRTLPAQMRAAALNQASWRGADMDFLLSVYGETDETLLRRQILWALAGSPSAEATEALIQAYRESDDPELRSAAVNALTQRDDERADAALRAILRGEDP